MCASSVLVYKTNNLCLKRLCLQEMHSLLPGQCARVTNHVLLNIKSSTLQYEVPIYGRVAIWLEEDRAMKGLEGFKDHWLLPVKMLAEVAKVTSMFTVIRVRSMSRDRQRSFMLMASSAVMATPLKLDHGVARPCTWGSVQKATRLELQIRGFLQRLSYCELRKTYGSVGKE